MADHGHELAPELGMSAFIPGPGENAPADVRRFAEAVAQARSRAVDNVARPHIRAC